MGLNPCHFHVPGAKVKLAPTRVTLLGYSGTPDYLGFLTELYKTQIEPYLSQSCKQLMIQMELLFSEPGFSVVLYLPSNSLLSTPQSPDSRCMSFRTLEGKDEFQI